MKDFKFIIIFISLFLSLSCISAIDEFGIFEQNTDVELFQICDSGNSLCDGCNITSISDPNSNIIISNVEMTKKGTDFNYTLNSSYTSELGTYVVNGICYKGSNVQIWGYIFDITVNGNEKPSGNVVVLFVILFIIIVSGMLGLILYNVFHMIQWDFDARDLIYNFSAYFALFVVYILGKEYFGNTFFNSFIVWTIGTTSLTNIILPIIAFVMSFFKGNWEKIGR